MGYTTIKTIEETLRSKAGAMGATRKEIPSRLQRLEAMGLFKRAAHARGAGEVETGELVIDNPTVTAITSGLEKPAAKEPRPPRAPRRERGTRLVSTEPADPEQPATLDAAAEPQDAEPGQEPVTAETTAAPETGAGASPEAASETAGAEPFRWVSGGATTAAIDEAPEGEPGETPAVAKPARKTPARKPAGTTRRKATTTRSSSRTKKEPAAPPDSPAADDATGAESAAADQPPG
jgi:hypothetical protein